MTGIALSGKGSGDGSTAPIDQAAAQLLALTVNAQHGLPRDSATKRRQVEAALNMDHLTGRSDREIAKLCDVSATFVATVRNPEAKERQAKNREASAVKNAVESDATIKRGDVVETQQVKSDFTPSLTQDYGPDADELKAMELGKVR